MTRDEILREMYLSMVIGAFISAVLCNVLPEIETGVSGLIMYLVFWMTSVMVVWGAIDIVDGIKERMGK